MMSFEKGIFGDDAEDIFWGTPELVQKLLSYLDLTSIRHLAESHKVTRRILRNTFTWNRLLKRIFPEDEVINIWNSFISEDETVLASERPKARLLAQILTLMKSSQRRDQLEMELLHIICEKFSILDPRTGSILVMTPIVDVRCSCLQVHRVSSWGFLLLEDVDAIMDLQEHSILNADRVTGALEGPILEALSSFLIRQHGTVDKLEAIDIECKSKETAESFATIVTRSETVLTSPRILVTEEIGAEGWSAIRRAVEHLSRVFGKEINLYSERQPMIAGKREDLQVIWEKVAFWEVASGGPGCEMVFDKGSGGWEENKLKWMMLDTIIDMTEEEWVEEVKGEFETSTSVDELDPDELGERKDNI